MNDPGELETYLHRHIPLSAAMGVRVTNVGGGADVPPLPVLSAPLGPNVNHRNTFFGGSAVTLAILAGWACVHVRRRASGLGGHLVIQRQRMEYLEPIRGLLDARPLAPSEAAWNRFRTAVERRGMGRIRLEVELSSGGRVVGRFEGAFALVPGTDDTDAP